MISEMNLASRVDKCIFIISFAHYFLIYALTAYAVGTGDSFLVIKAPGE